PKEILVVDDSSADNTAEIASRYADRGVRYIRGEWRSVGNARNAGLKETNSIYLVFLDADNMLHPDYLHHGLQTLEENPNAAIAYCNLQHFGEDDTLRMFPDTFDWQRFEYHNHIDACAILRRDSLMQVGGFSHGIDQDGDWVTWRRILKLGWQAVKSNGLCLYRIHSDNMSHKLKEKGYAKRSGFLEEEATLCITLNKADLSSWQQTAAFLQRQTYPHKSVHLVIIDNSNNAQLKQAVRNTLEVIDYGSYTYLQEPLAMAQNVPENLADSVLLSRNLNRLAQMVPEGLVFLLAEDVIPPDNIFNTLIEHFSCDILSVSGVVKPENGRTTLVWNWTHKGAPSYINKGKSVEDVGGAGIDCTVMRSAFLRNSIFHAGNPHMDPMLNFYSQFGSKQGKKSLVDWSAICTLSQERIS
ncbi:MAG: glycosyltransferase family 2 protein, partial [Candidatus Peribacteraceae bacterium]|nr:glycosyltransferase family 2 protein [Candidatus Peribacteraceae bacterium]